MNSAVGHGEKAVTMMSKLLSLKGREKELATAKEQPGECLLAAIWTFEGGNVLKSINVVVMRSNPKTNLTWPSEGEEKTDTTNDEV